MSIASVPLRIAQVSDIHCGESSFQPAAMEAVVAAVNAMRPDLVAVVGDLTANGYQWEFEEAAGWIDQFEPPTLVLPGNHDYRNVGYIHFQRRYGRGFCRFRQAFDELRAERLAATGFTVVGVDSAEPDVNEGNVGLENYPWMREQFGDPEDVKIFAIHHHLVSIPGTGRERNIITDAGDVLAELSRMDVDVVLSGHKHVPFFWAVNGMLVCNSGTATTRRVRGLTPPSWNELAVDASTVKVYLHYPDGRRELAVVFSRRSRALAREVFLVTDDFLQTNQILAP
jgi:3',5'-cyclic-AMP phosphodiesterase